MPARERAKLKCEGWNCQNDAAVLRVSGTTKFGKKEQNIWNLCAEHYNNLKTGGQISIVNNMLYTKVSRLPSLHETDGDGSFYD